MENDKHFFEYNMKGCETTKEGLLNEFFSKSSKESKQIINCLIVINTSLRLNFKSESENLQFAQGNSDLLIIRCHDYLLSKGIDCDKLKDMFDLLMHRLTTEQIRCVDDTKWTKVVLGSNLFILVACMVSYLS